VPVRLAPLETASGVVVGEDPEAEPLPGARADETPLAALEQAILPALTQPPCLVSFSGGRDSSAILALAVSLARRKGLDPPLPVTVRFRSGAESEESRWQERVIGELALEEWPRIEVGDELGVLGPFARRALARHGLLWPPNVHALSPVLEAARGGSLLTGLGGDEFLGGVPPLRRALLPRRLRRARYRRRAGPGPAWLRPEASASLNAAIAAEQAAEPLRWSGRVAWMSRLRQLSLLRASAAELASDAAAALYHPFLDQGFLAAVARGGSRRGFGSRNAAMQSLFAGLLGEEALTRQSKATFTRALWGPDAREFARRWSGAGPSADLIEAPQLRRAWTAERPDFRSATPLQSAWLAEASRATLLEAAALEPAGTADERQRHP
jgi:asparagine synthetase B (glutamine-hydrolysing)